jgi:phosphomevalonate kinase
VRAVEARAPGKLFLTGEYAVLAGAPALVAAVDRHACVRVELAERRGPLVVESLAEGERRTVADVEAGELPQGDVGCVIAALRATRACREDARLAAAVTVDSRSFLDGAQKLGLGRSAATLAAMVGALLAAAGDTDRQHVLAAAVSANVLFQAGLGSGGDVAASVHGGLVEVIRRAGDLHATRRRLPAGLHLVAGWTGESASTVPLLRRFASAQQGAAEGPATLAALCAVAARAAGAVADGDAAGLADAVDRSADLLAQLGGEVGIPIVTPALARLVRAARGVGAAAKPSGAGGGDCGIALAHSAEQAAAVRAAWEAEGITPLALALAPDGVTVG